jgi:hypothetical protein
MRTTAEELSATVGFDVASTLDGIGQATIGTRELLLRDVGRRRFQLCAVFSEIDVTIPALAWSLVRPVTLALGQNSRIPRPSPPTVLRPPPKAADLLDPDEEATTIY